MKILRYPHSTLRAKSAHVTSFDDDLRTLVADMSEAMTAANGVALAAPQVGSLLRVFVIHGGVAGGVEGSEPMAFINPEILSLSGETAIRAEGCLSFPFISVDVKRSPRCRARAYDLDGEPFEVEAEDLFAQAIQHETEHLDGRLLVDHVGPVTRDIIRRKMLRARAR